MPSGPEQVGIEQQGIAKILSSYWLKVPPNQREYAWTKDEVNRLLHDFSKAIFDDAENYFLGSIVTVPTAPGRLQVVDGQQRLATTAILLAAMREYLDGRDEMISKAIERVLCDIDTKLRQQVPKLQLNTDDNEFFRSRILALEKDDRLADCRFPSHEKMLAAKKLALKHIENILSGLKASDHGDELARWLQFLEHKATVILLKVPSTANAYKMFETLNDRGLQTSQSDLIKNYLFGEAEDRLEEAQSKWSLMRGALEMLDEEDITLTFLRQAAISIYGHMRKDDLFDTVESKIRGSRQAVQLLSSLEAAANDYVSILSSDSDKWNRYPPSTRRAIQTLGLLSVKPMRPLMLSVARQFPPKEADRAFRKMISWKVRLLIVGGTRSESVEKPLAVAAHDISERRIKTAGDLRSKIRPIIPTDVQFREAFEAASVSKSALARYYLRSLEMVAKEEPTPWFIPNDDSAIINLEHILPRSPTADNWPHYDRDLVRTYYRKLGNQALLQASSNLTLKGAPFSEKRTVFEKSPYVLTSQIADSEDWLPEHIAVRQKKLAELALQAWPL